MHQQANAKTLRGTRNCLPASKCIAVLSLMSGLVYPGSASAEVATDAYLPASPQVQNNLAGAGTSLASWKLASQDSAAGSEVPPDPDLADANPSASSEGGPEGRISTTRGTVPEGDLAMKMTNPVTDLWLIEMEFNNFKLEKNRFIGGTGRAFPTVAYR